jgi:FG-GAP repeat/FG-GAP-like repeat
MFTNGLTRLAIPAAIALCTAGLIGIDATTATAAVCGAAVTGDINGDGQAEVAVGEPGDASFAGAVHVFYGTVDGLVTDPSGTALNDQLFTQATPGVPGASEAGDGFGSATQLADLNGDGCADLAVGVFGENNGTGSIVVLYGSPAGLTTTGAQAFSENSLFGAGHGRADEQFGATFTAGDVNDDGIADLAVGAPGEAVTTSGGDQGGVAVLYGATGGLNSGSAPAFITQATPGVPGGPEDGDRFGESLAAGDFGGDGVADLAVGVPGENQAAGVVETLPGQAGTGVSGAGGAAFTQDTSGVPGAAEAGDEFGLSVAAGDATGDGRADLAVGVAGENDSRGAVSFLPGSASGLTGTGSQYWSQDSAGVEGIAAAGDAFGFSLVMAPLDNGPLADLAIGVPFDAIGSTPNAGGVNILLGTAAGLSAAEAGQRFSQNTSGIAGISESGDGFGFSLTAQPVQTTGEDSLVIGAPFETLGSFPEAGMVHQLATFEFGPNPFGSVTLNLEVAGVQGASEDSSLFALAVG